MYLFIQPPRVPRTKTSSRKLTASTTHVGRQIAPTGVHPPYLTRGMKARYRDPVGEQACGTAVTSSRKQKDVWPQEVGVIQAAGLR